MVRFSRRRWSWSRSRGLLVDDESGSVVYEVFEKSDGRKRHKVKGVELGTEKSNVLLDTC
jgi:hypothetical protein